jgi:hypothetical protein
MCSEDGIHATVDQCLVALRGAMTVWARPAVAPVQVVATAPPRRQLPLGRRRCRTRAEIEHVRDLYRRYSVRETARRLHTTPSRVLYCASGRAKASDDPMRMM